MHQETESSVHTPEPMVAQVKDFFRIREPLAAVFGKVMVHHTPGHTVLEEDLVRRLADPVLHLQQSFPMAYLSLARDLLHGHDKDHLCREAGNLLWVDSLPSLGSRFCLFLATLLNSSFLSMAFL